ncbi:MAG: hypothetical protein H0T89_11015 [Deltaproteobacteria bacterium]|nr:hypothetical protein [Deltaproteobacteria bacterium]
MTRMVIALFALALLGCESSSSLFGPGLDQQVLVRGGQLVQGVIVDPGCDPATSSECGPAVTSVSRNQASVKRGDGTVIVTGRIGPGGTALHVWAEGDRNHWVALPSAFDVIQPDELTYSIELEFSFAIQTDVVRLHLQAADKSGKLGPVSVAEFTMLPDVPPAALLVSLGWNATADLDLHVQLPDGTIVGAKNINSTMPSPNPGDLSWMYGGFLDHDSNQECQIDAINRENVVWLKREGDPMAMPPPSGRYKVYANLFAPCGASSVTFEAVAQLNGEVIERGASILYEFDARRLPADSAAPGLLLMEFEVP